MKSASARSGRGRGRTRASLLAAALLSAGCASTPDAIRDAPDGPPLGVVREAPQDYIGQRVRWGGTIADVANEVDRTLVYIVARELQENGRPARSDASIGRFVAVLEGFHDPVILARGRELTAVGALGEATRATVGQFDYLYPVVEAELHRLWPEREPRDYHRHYHPYPFYDPWYPYRYYPPYHWH